MKIPKKLKIGEHYYDVKKVRIVDWKDSSIAGQISYGDKKMRLKVFEKDHRVTEDTFFHEIAHGLLKELEFNHPKISKFRNDEVFVQEMGLTLRKTFLDLLESQEVGK